MRGDIVMRAPLLRIAIGLPIALLGFIAFLIYLLIQFRPIPPSPGRSDLLTRNPASPRR
jgi:hypothetical protein